MNMLIDARRVLFSGLLAPTALTTTHIDALLAESAGPLWWTVGSIAFPASKLESLAAHLSATMSSAVAPLRINVLVDEPLGTAAMRAAVFDRYMTPAAEIVGLEAADAQFVADAASLRLAATGIGPLVTPFLTPDLAPASAPTPPVGAILDMTERSDPEALAQRLRFAAAERIPLKVYVPGSVWTAADDGSVIGCGLINLLAAVGLTCDGATQHAVTALSDRDRDHFRLSRAGLHWKDNSVGIPALRKTRTLVVACGIPYLSATLAELVPSRLLPGQ